ncbi:multi-sensor hybrid histidine kinase [Desulfatibacillum aliphaticivorans]|uniref:histidine kinase n=1 Tax=Desulfatibacillum aliphaticivorans TaxID=218208 RepID=B8FEV5_DESAL|nr:GAF domain-containing protein [Desulfatibacillum aliphaticivorans]ACL03632.1 multi-sensor hybrid histidine kinase [Desulfatibacillum aliphaticivorans]
MKRARVEIFPHHLEGSGGKGRAQDDGAVFETLYNKTPVMMQALDVQGNIISVNDYWLVNLELSRAEVLGRPLLDFLSPESRMHAAKEMLPALQTEGFVFDVELEFQSKRGSLLEVSFSAVKDKTKEGVECFPGFLTDITRRRASEKKLKLDEARLEALLSLSDLKTLENSSEQEMIQKILEDAVLLTESEGGYFHFVNQDQVNIELFTWSKSVRNQCKAPRDHKYALHEAGIWADCIRTGVPQIHNDYPSHPLKKGYPEGHIPIRRHMSVPIFDREAMIAIVGVANKEEPYDESDVRQLTLFAQALWNHIRDKRSREETKALELRLRQSQKMEAMGALAGGIAHDFNNILAPIIGYTEMELDEAISEQRPHDGLEAILKASYRARDLVKQILTFSRGAEHEMGPVRIQSIIKESIKLIRSSFPSTITITQMIDEKCGPVLADPTQIHQIIMNLCTNSLHAMQDQGGSLDISLREMEVHSPDLSLFPNLMEGKHLRLAISDTGRGMERETMERIFEPYFTTKAKEEGTGLGLSVVHGIVTSINGAVKVYSEPGKGSSFHVLLPVMQSAEPEVDLEPLDAIPHGNERILVVDDEEMMVTMIESMLERLGYTAECATRSTDALALFKADPNAYDALFTDLTMPGFTGIQLAQKCKEIRPDLPVVLCTGFSERTTGHIIDSVGINVTMNKPIVIRDLAMALREALDRP